MGDRGNICIRQSNGTDHLVFYTHWGGSFIIDVLHTALSRKQRWEDDAYLARIIFCELVRGCEYKETGFGISVNSLCDNEHHILVVDPANKCVHEMDKGMTYDCSNDWMKPTSKPRRTWTFQEFISQSVEQLKEGQ